MIKEIILDNGFYSIILEHKDDNLYVDFKVYSIFTVSKGRKQWIEYRDEADLNKTVENVAEALPLIQGYLKYDGCINYTYPSQECYMLHGCSLERFRSILKVFEAIYRESAKLMSTVYDYD